MRAEEVLPKLSHRRFPLAVRIIASILVVTFLAQDIAWAHPAPFIDKAAQNNKLAAESFFKQKNLFIKAYVREVDALVRNKLASVTGKAPNEMTIDDVKRALLSIQKEDAAWLQQNNISFSINDNEALISFSPGYFIRYFKFDLQSPNFTEHDNHLIVTRSVNKDGFLYKQLYSVKALPAPEQQKPDKPRRAIKVIDPRLTADFDRIVDADSLSTFIDKIQALGYKEYSDEFAGLLFELLFTRLEHDFNGAEGFIDKCLDEISTNNPFELKTA